MMLSLQVAVDIANQMLKKLREKNKLQGYSEFVDVVYGDAETVDFPHESFEWVICSSAFIWMEDLAGALARWRDFLVPGGGIAFHSFPEEAFVRGRHLTLQVLLQKSYGIKIHSGWICSLRPSINAGCIEKE